MLHYVAFFLLILLSSVNSVSAWIEPQDGQNIKAPINTGVESQSKQGDLNLKGNLSIDQNKEINVGNAYLSSGGDYMHLSNNEWYDGAKWNATGKGMLLQFLGQTLAIYKHDESGGHTYLSSIDASGNLKTSGQIFTNNLGSLPNGWIGIHTQSMHARDAVRANYLCLGGGANGDGAGDCRNAWPGGVNTWWEYNWHGSSYCWDLRTQTPSGAYVTVYTAC